MHALAMHSMQRSRAIPPLCRRKCRVLQSPADHMCALAGELKTGYLEKRVGEHSGRQSVPLGESFKWQKRYFVLTEPKGMLYYFKSADDPPNYRGVINLRQVPAYTTA